MKIRTRSLRAGVVIGCTAIALGLGRPATALDAEDVEQAVDRVTVGVEEAVETYLSTNSVAATFTAIRWTGSDTVEVLVEDTDKPGYWSYGRVVRMELASADRAVQGYLVAVDDPSTAGDLITADDLETLAAEGDWIAGGLRPLSVVGNGVQGNLWEDPYGMGGVYGALLFIPAERLSRAMEGTNLDEETDFLEVSAHALGDTVGPVVLEPVEWETAPVFEITNPPVREVLRLLPV